MLRLERLLLALCLTVPSVAHADAPTDFVLPSGDRVPGAYFDELPSMAAQSARVRAAVKSALGVELGRIPIHVVTIDAIRVLHDEVGGRLRPGWQLHGFELDGHVFVRRGLGGVSDEVLTHECLHAVSQKFSNEAHARGVGGLVEGITQYLTLDALAARPLDPRLRAERNRTYMAYTAIADAVATLVGEETLRKAYLGGGFGPLAQRVDAARHQRHVLERASQALDRSDERAALAIVTGAR